MTKNCCNSSNPGLKCRHTPDHSSGTSPGQSGYGKITFVYDNAGRVKRRDDQLGDTCTYTFDLAGRMTQRDYRTAANSPTGTIADSDTFTFDKAGRMLTAASGRYSNTVTYTFDPAGRKSSEALTISSQTYTVSTEYNTRNELTKYTLPDSSISERTYHATGALNLLKLDSNTVSTRSYDSGDRVTSEVLGNGITESRSYSNDNLLTGISYSGSSVGNLTYTWDSNKNKTSESISGTMSGYGFTQAGTAYDDEDRLTGYARANSNLTQSWSLTSVGDWSSITTNSTAQNRTHGATHELTVAGGSNVTTDVKGNITLLPSTLNASTLGLVYDFDNKMKSIDLGNNSSVDVEYKYDALGRRVARSGSSGSYAYVHSDQQTLVDYGLGDAPSSPLYRYVYGSYIDEPVVRKGAGSGGTIYYYHRNQQYSVTAITNSGGTLVERYAYQAYGEPTILDGSGSVISSSSINNRYTYTGREWDATIGLYHFRARWMSGLTGRFLTRDPKRPKTTPVFGDNPNRDRRWNDRLWDLGVELGYSAYSKNSVDAESFAPYHDGFSLYGRYHALQSLDSGGEAIFCFPSIGGFAGFVAAVSASCAICGDTCGRLGPVCCFGVGLGAGASASGGLSLGGGCITPKWSHQGNVQGALACGLGGGVTFPGGPGPMLPPVSTYSFGPGAGVAITVEGCYAF